MNIRDAPKLKRVSRLDCIKLDAKDRTYFTEEGYLIDHPILTSCGIFEYVNTDGSVRRELRLPEHVFNPKSLESYKGKPIILTHDAGVVDKDNVDREQIGTILSNGYPSGDDVRAEIIIHNTDVMKNSGLKELSLGYNLDLIEESGTWNGEHYDAIQTNIVINHLALVESARAGEQARLNIDSSDEAELRGGIVMVYKNKKSRNDGGAMTAEELQKALEAYKTRKAERTASSIDETETNSDVDNSELKKIDEENSEENTADKGSTAQDIVKLVKDRRDRRDSEDDPKDIQGAMGVIAQQDEDIDMLLACLEKFFQEEANNDSDIDIAKNNKDNDMDNTDSSEDNSKSLNADSADKIFRERLNICRIGDKLNIDGLERKSIIDGKKAIINKVYPDMRLDGKSNAYINAAYDLAINEAGKRKDVNYQRQQMLGTKPTYAMDSNTKSMALLARERMIEREGGNE